MPDENLIAQLSQKRVVSETFRRLTPQKKEQVYQAGLRLFGKYGYDGLAVDRFCHEAGISKGSFFQYFKSKSHLLEFCLLMFDDYLAKWIVRIKEKETVALVRGRLQYAIDSFGDKGGLTASERQFYLFVTRALHHSGVVIKDFDLERHLKGYVGDIIERSVQTGEVRGDLSSTEIAYMVSLLVRALSGDRFMERTDPTRGASENLVSLIFDGIKA